LAVSPDRAAPAARSLPRSGTPVEPGQASPVPGDSGMSAHCCLYRGFSVVAAGTAPAESLSVHYSKDLFPGNVDWEIN